MKKYLGVLRIIAFLILLCMVLVYLNHVFRFKYGDGIAQLDTFYELDENTVDVLVLGSSHAFVNINNGVLWDEYGIASFDLGASSQPMWNSYYYLKEALKTQTPELIVLEGFTLAFGDLEYSEDASIIKSTFGLRWSPDKVNAIKISTPEEDLNSVLLTYGQYHSRYSELNRGDFLWSEDIQVETTRRTHYRHWKGQCLFNTSVPQTVHDVTNITERDPIVEKEEVYYRKIIELAQENNIPIIVVIVPYVVEDHHQRCFNRGADIAKEYNVEFLNCNMNTYETGVNYNTDYIDIVHMNVDGSRKFSLFLGEYLKEHYVISDRRGNAKYDSWQKNAEYTSQFYNDYVLQSNKDVDTLGQLLKNDEYNLMISVDGSCNTSDENLRPLFDSLDIEYDASGIWYRTKDGIVWNSGDGDNEKYARCSMHDFGMLRKDGVNTVIVDNTEKKVVENGVNIIVYDNILETVVDCIGIDNADYSVTHMDEMLTF